WCKIPKQQSLKSNLPPPNVDRSRSLFPLRQPRQGDIYVMRRDRRFQRTALLGVVLSLLLTGFAMPQATAQEKSLYERIGGYNALAAVVDDFIGRLLADKQFEKFFAGFSVDS